MKHIKLYEQFVLESKEEDEAKAILQDLLDEYDPWELQEMTPEEAEETVDSYGHKGSKAKKIAGILQHLASNGLFEGKTFKVGDKWEWHTSDGVKVVSITNVKSNGDVVGREDGSSEDFIVRDANKYLKKKVTESIVNEARNLTREELVKILQTKYALNFTKDSEEFDGEEGGIWLGGSEGKVMPDGKTEMFNYYHGGSKFPQGINKDFAKFLDKCGWYGQFADPGTVMLWPR
jgi:hypothetical protein